MQVLINHVLGIFCSFGDPNTLLSPYTHLIRVGGSDFDLEKLCLLEELALDISQKRLNCTEVRLFAVFVLG